MLIPHKLFQTYKTQTIPSQLKKESSSWQKSNPDLELHFMDDKQCLKFIKNNFDEEVLQAYISLPLGIMKADFWRIAVIYIYGGIYSDLDIIMNISLDTLLNENTEAFFIQELDNIANFVFGAIPKHPVLKNALDFMVKEAKNIREKDVQDFGMHPLHHFVREYYKIQGTNYIGDKVVFLNNEELKQRQILIHNSASSREIKDYDNWRKMKKVMEEEREQSNDVLFITTFNQNGYLLYGKSWIETFVPLANYYPNFKAKIYYEGFKPQENHPNIEWIKYEKAIPDHPEWKKEYNGKTTHADYVKTMTIRFSHKAFVIQHALDNNNNDYICWVDGDVIFKNADYTNFPDNILGDKFLACQVEHAQHLNHVESGLLIFNNKDPRTQKWNEQFKKNYTVEQVLAMGEPYDGFIVWKSILTGGLTNDIFDLNAFKGGGIQSDPNETFLNPLIKDKFLHNIGWTGKNQYEMWDKISSRDDIYAKMKVALFGYREDNRIKKENAMNKIEKLRKLQRVK